MYASASESFLRLFAFEILNKEPPVMKLPLHLPEEKIIIFEPEEARVIVALGPPETKLTAFFKLCTEDPAARLITYVDIPRRYRWDTKNKKWASRKYKLRGVSNSGDDMSPMVGRIPVIDLSPRQKEFYFFENAFASC